MWEDVEMKVPNGDEKQEPPFFTRFVLCDVSYPNRNPSRLIEYHQPRKTQKVHIFTY